MNVEIYWCAVALMGSGAAISHYADIAPHLYRPLGSGPFSLITTIASYGWIVAAVAGFFVFRWYDPLIGVGLGFIAVIPLRALALNSGIYPLITMAICAAGIGCGISLFFI